VSIVVAVVGLPRRDDRNDEGDPPDTERCAVDGDACGSAAEVVDRNGGKRRRSVGAGLDEG